MTRDDADRPVLQAVDGATATIDLVFDSADYEDVPGLVGQVGAAHPYALLLVRRGGWAVGLAEGTTVTDSRVGTRYVQGKTKAGGWSQQRYARRRAQQADGLIEAAASAAHALFPRRDRLVVSGGDRLLLRDTVTALEARGRAVRLAGRRLTVPDPRRSVLDDAARAACAVRVAVVDPPA